ncbi:MAG: ABC transporter permease [Methylotenera sp.]|nr:ABC transporter permease [Oligoflexia bacterium]
MIPKTHQVALAVARVTFSEVIRDKILYNIILLAVLLFGVSILASQLSFITPERIILDFGMSAVNLSCSMIAIFTGSWLIGKEFERRTVFVALSRPISRHQFVLGKYLGLMQVIALNWVLLSLLLSGLLLLTGGTFNPTLITGLFLFLLQSLVLGSLALMVSSFTTTSLSVIICIGFYLIGNNISQIRSVADQSKSDSAKAVLKGLALILPNLEHFTLGTKVTYGLPVTGAFVATATGYAFVLSAFCLICAGIFLKRKEQ